MEKPTAVEVFTLADYLNPKRVTKKEKNIAKKAEEYEKKEMFAEVQMSVKNKRVRKLNFENFDDSLFPSVAWKMSTNTEADSPAMLSFEQLLGEATRLEHCLTQVTPAKLKLPAFKQLQRHNSLSTINEVEQTRADRPGKLKRCQKNLTLDFDYWCPDEQEVWQHSCKSRSKSAQFQKGLIGGGVAVAAVGLKAKSPLQDLFYFEAVLDLKPAPAKRFFRQIKAQFRWQTEDESWLPECKGLLSASLRVKQVAEF